MTYSANEILDLSLDIGLNLLKAGAEIKRVEDTIKYVAQAYGASSIDVFAIPTLIIATITVGEESSTSKIKRNGAVNTDLYLLEKYNQLSRSIVKEKPSISTIKAQIAKIKNYKDYNILIRFLGALMTSFGFTLFFGGSWLDALASLIVAFVMMLFITFAKKSFNQLVHTLIASLIGGIFSVIVCWLHIGEHLNSVMIGVIMLVIPGLSIGTSIRDILSDDVLSGSVRLFQATVTSMAIAAGFSICTKLYGGEIAYMQVPSYPIIIVSGIIGTLGYAILFNIKYKRIWVVGLGGLLTSLLYGLLVSRLNTFLAVLCCSLLTSIFSEICARIFKAPTTVFLLPSIIILVPGAALFYAMYYLINARYSQFTSSLLSTLLASLAIAVGIILISVLTTIIFKIITLIKKKKMA